MLAYDDTIIKTNAENKLMEPESHDDECEFLDSTDTSEASNVTSGAFSTDDFDSSNNEIDALSNEINEDNLCDSIDFSRLLNFCNISIDHNPGENSVNNLKKNDEYVCKKFADKGTQVVSGDLSFSFLKTHIQTNSDLLTFCNIRKFEVLNELAKIFDEIYPHKKKFAINKRKNSFDNNEIKNKFKIYSYDKIISNNITDNLQKYFL